MNSPRLMTQTEFAKYRGVGKSAVSNWKARDLVVFGEDTDGSIKVDVARTEARLNVKVDPTRGRPTTAQAGGQATLPLETRATATTPARTDDLSVVRTDLLKQQVIEKTMNNARRAGDLVPVIEYQRRAVELGRTARERMQSMLRTLAERFASEKDPRQIVAVGSLEIDRVFTELADAVETGLLADADEDGDAALMAEADAEEAAEIEDDAEAVA